MNRTPALQKFVDNFAVKAFGTKQGDKNMAGHPLCVFCGKPTDVTRDFKDELSVKEFTISGVCQKCQDETFGQGGHL